MSTATLFAWPPLSVLISHVISCRIACHVIMRMPPMQIFFWLPFLYTHFALTRKVAVVAFIEKLKRGSNHLPNIRGNFAIQVLLELTNLVASSTLSPETLTKQLIGVDTLVNACLPLAIGQSILQHMLIVCFNRGQTDCCFPTFAADRQHVRSLVEDIPFPGIMLIRLRPRPRLRAKQGSSYFPAQKSKWLTRNTKSETDEPTICDA